MCQTKSSESGQQKTYRGVYNKIQGQGRIWIEGEFWVAEVKRAFQEPHLKLREILACDEKTLRAKGIASYLAKEISSKFNILHERELLSHAKRYPEFGEVMTGFFEKRVV